MLHQYRVFVSYTHTAEDQLLMDAVVNRLHAIGASPLFDQNLKPGDKFSDEIRRFIAHAHVFMPILTKEAASRPWVHQEIGYAMGLSIPIFPLAFGSLPDGLATQLQALTLETVAEIEDKLTPEYIEYRAASKTSPGDSVFQCAQSLSDRTRLLVEYASDVEKLNQYGMIRQRSAFGSFSIPDKRPGASVWKDREDGHERSLEERQSLRDERQIMERHARSAGCRLIIDPEAVKSHGADATITRIKTLIDVLSSMPDDHVEVVFAKGEIQTGLVIVGDWFLADAVVPLYGQNYQKTVFTRHGPSVIKAVKLFDQDFDDIKREAGTASRSDAIKHLEMLITRLSSAKITSNKA
ncbi:toll/interleukin-1 receptor domain-containing protein [Oligosphaera ethanolica]|uniref:TIR domain-containing protein n=1 Tax=Oligosphaera ethanolica TaxID=760260 RepID=A0AAE3VHQ2_9BACT|nr:toll/interleukin-1 receptor domain-containing protein [Oligosphaera ethanolica]MDQ0290513.1 hypothetical protein [Oligosphaera ethanolica]